MKTTRVEELAVAYRTKAGLLAQMGADEASADTVAVAEIAEELVVLRRALAEEHRALAAAQSLTIDDENSFDLFDAALPAWELRRCATDALAKRIAEEDEW